MNFFLGTHRPAWLARAGVPLFVSRRTLDPMKRLPRAVAPWALDSGGFSELSLFGEWRTSASDYVRQVRRFRDEIGNLQWAAPQDWMCEPIMIQRTGLSVEEHQRRTVANFLELRQLAPDVPWTPVLQGWSIASYWRHVDEYEAAGVALADEQVVGVGTVCRRQSTVQAGLLMQSLAQCGLRIHGFGFKVLGLRAVHEYLESADSLAWSFHARKRPPLPGHTHKNCANCFEYAMQWRRELLDGLTGDSAGAAA